MPPLAAMRRYLLPPIASLRFRFSLQRRASRYAADAAFFRGLPRHFRHAIAAAFCFAAAIIFSFRRRYAAFIRRLRQTPRRHFAAERRDMILLFDFAIAISMRR